MVKNYGFMPKDQEQATKLAHYLAFKGVSFDIGTTAGKRRPLVVAKKIGFWRRLMIYLNVGYMKYLEHVNYFIIKEV